MNDRVQIPNTRKSVRQIRVDIDTFKVCCEE